MQSYFGGKSFVAVADYGRDAGKCCEFVGGALSITACCDDPSLGVASVDVADVGAGFAVGFGGYGAGVDDDHIGFGGHALSGPGTTQKSSNRFSVCAGGAAAEVLNMEGRGHGVSLLELECGGVGRHGWRKAVFSLLASQRRFAPSKLASYAISRRGRVCGVESGQGTERFPWRRERRGARRGRRCGSRRLRSRLRQPGRP